MLIITHIVRNKRRISDFFVRTVKKNSSVGSRQLSPITTPKVKQTYVFSKSWFFGREISQTPYLILFKK